MGISRSTCHGKPAISLDDTALVEAVAAISERFEVYGYRWTQAALRHRGLIVNHKEFRRLTRERDLQARRYRRCFVGAADLIIKATKETASSSG